MFMATFRGQIDRIWCKTGIKAPNELSPDVRKEPTAVNGSCDREKLRK